MCPEGADISEASRHQPVPGPAAAGAHPWPQDSPGTYLVLVANLGFWGLCC